MNKYQITYDMCGRACVFTCNAESDGEAVELFDEFAERCDEYVELLSVVEVKK